MMRKLHSIAAALAVCVLVASAALAQQKTIKDPAEYNAYIAALNIGDPAQKAAAMEAFLVKFPSSVVKEDALAQAMAAYQQAGNTAAVEKTARRVLQAGKGNVRALAVLTVLERAKATQGDNPALADMQTHARQGVASLKGWKKPDGTSDAEFAKLRRQMDGIFNGALGFAAMQTKDYATARTAYLAAAKADPGNLQDVYQLGIAELEMSPVDPGGFWHIARAISLAKGQKRADAVKSIDAYGRAKYKRYHGGEDGWDELVKQAATRAAPPKDFVKSIARAPTEAEIAVKAVQDNDPASFSFEDMEFILGLRDASPANKEAAERVWRALQERGANAAFKIRVKVIAATATTIEAAITDDNKKADKVDLHVVMAKPLDKPPAPGTLVNVVGRMSDYTPAPFTFTMIQGAI
jgi:tetratricopeptide (TPR) repeat protein